MDHLPWRRDEHLRPKVAFFKYRTVPPIPTISVSLRPVFSVVLILQKGLPPFEAVPLDLEQSTSTFQAFFFLNLINTVSQLWGDLISVHELITDDETPLLRTEGLNKLLDGPQIPENESNKIARGLDVAENYICYAFQTIPSCRWNKDCFMIFWSLALLHECLRSKLYQGLESTYAKEIAQWIHEHDIFSSMLVQAGWCPTVLRRTAFTLLESWILLSTPMVSTSFELEQGKLHSECLGRDCKAFHTDGSSYRTRHLPDCGNIQQCSLRGIDVDRLAMILKAGLIPIVRSVVDSYGIHIDIISGEATEFVAISHVWAGGMGNPIENNVYECQLINLHIALTTSRTLKGTTYYWLDTLCIPVTNSDDEERQEAVRILRDLAINDMARVYASASRVFALDPLLQQIESADLGAREQGILIQASPWMARSWTLQEAALAVRLDIRFLDTTITFSDIDFPDGPLSKSQLQNLWHRDVDRLEVESPLPRLNVELWLRRLYQRVIRRKVDVSNPKPRRKRLSELPSLEEQLATVWQELSKRSSKEPDDIALILAVFLGTNAAEVARSKGTERVFALLRSYGSIPTDLLFTPVEGNHGKWEPQLPRCGRVDYDLQSSTHLKFTDDDLLEICDFQDLVFAPIFNVRIADMIDLRDPGGRRVILKVLFDSKTLYPNNTTVDQNSFYILPKSAVNHAYQFTTSREYLGVLVLKFARDQEIMHVKYQQTFRWRVATHDDCRPLWQQLNMPNLGPDMAAIYAEFLSTKRVVLDMGVREWKSLSWHRTQFYPFRGHSIRTAQPLFLVEILRLIGCAFLLFRLILWSIAYLPKPSGFGETPNVTAKVQIPRWLLGSMLQAILVILRLVLGEREERLLKKYFRIPLQRIWASSFKTSGSVLNDPGRPAIKVGIHQLIYLGAMYTMLLTMAILLFVLHIQFIQDNLDRERTNASAESLGFMAVMYVIGSIMAGATTAPDKEYPMKMVLLSATVLASWWFTVELMQRVAYITYLASITYLPGKIFRRLTSDARLNPDVTKSHDPRNDWMVRTYYLYGGVLGILMPALLIPFFFLVVLKDDGVLELWILWIARGLVILLSILSGGFGIMSIGYAYLEEKPTMNSDPLLPSEPSTAPEPTTVELQSYTSQDSNAEEDEEREEEARSDWKVARAVSGAAKVMYRAGKFSVETIIKSVGEAWVWVEWFSNKMGAAKGRNQLRQAQQRAAERYYEL